jgi:sporulation protein YlmC with PRC-barrel domain
MTLSFTTTRCLALSSLLLLLAGCEAGRREANLPPPPASRPAPPAPAPAPGTLGALRAGELIGRTVYNREGAAVGTVDDVVMHRRDRVTAAILSMGGFLGFGERVVAPDLTREVLERVDNYQPRDWDRVDRDRLLGVATR